MIEQLMSANGGDEDAWVEHEVALEIEQYSAWAALQLLRQRDRPGWQHGDATEYEVDQSGVRGGVRMIDVGSP